MIVQIALVGLRLWLGVTALGLFAITLVASAVAIQTEHKIAAARQAGISALISMRTLRREYQFAAVAFFSSLSASVIVIAILVAIH